MDKGDRGKRVDLNYYHTLIAVAEDCPVGQSVVPEERGGKPTSAVLQYRMLAGCPFVFTQEEVLFRTWLQRQELPQSLSEKEIARLREQFFSRPQACLRASPLPKRYGWGLRFDREGRVALCPMESQEYREIVSGENPEGVKVLKAMRSKWA